MARRVFHLSGRKLEGERLVACNQSKVPSPCFIPEPISAKRRNQYVNGTMLKLTSPTVPNSGIIRHEEKIHSS